MFTAESIVARVWADAVSKGDKEYEEVPNLFNLRSIVTQIMEGGN